MQIGLPTQCITNLQFESVDEHITTEKSNSDCYFIPATSGYLRSYLVG